MQRALVIVDVQEDFVEGGSLAVGGGRDCAAKITKFVEDNRDDYQLIVATKCWHKDPGTHWSTEPDFIDTWPVHCEADRIGSAFAKELGVTPDVVIRKGYYTPAYSGFEGTSDEGMQLKEILDDAAIDGIDVVGIALDYCVMQTALDGRAEQFAVRLLKDYTVAVHPENSADNLMLMRNAGITIN